MQGWGAGRVWWWRRRRQELLLVVATLLASCHLVSAIVVDLRSPDPPTQPLDSGNCSVLVGSVPSLTSITNTTANEPAHGVPVKWGRTHSIPTVVTFKPPPPPPVPPHILSTPPPISTTLSRPTTLSATQPTPSRPILPEARLEPSTTLPPVSKHTLVELEDQLTRLMEVHLSLTLDEEMTTRLRKPYLERLRFVNHEMVDKVLQAPAELPSQEGQCILTTHQLQLSDLRRKLSLLLLSLPQSVMEMQEAIHDQDLDNYFFRTAEKNILDVTECRKCFAKDALGKCRELFFCKSGRSVSRMGQSSLEDLLRQFNR